MRTLLMLLRKNLDRAERLHDQKKKGVSRALQAALRNATKGAQGPQDLLHLKRALGRVPGLEPVPR